jgi:hypothetical protein
MGTILYKDRIPLEIPVAAQKFRLTFDGVMVKLGHHESKKNLKAG